LNGSSKPWFLNKLQYKRWMLRLLLFLKVVCDPFIDSYLCVKVIFYRDFSPPFAFLMPKAQSRWKAFPSDGVSPHCYDAAFVGKRTGTKAGAFERMAGTLWSSLLLFIFSFTTLLSPRCIFVWCLCNGSWGIIIFGFHVLTTYIYTLLDSYDGTIAKGSFAMHHLSRTVKASMQSYGHDDIIRLDEHKKLDWGLQQILNTSNLPDGTPLHMDLGAAPHQVEHHLFPGLPAEKFATVTPILKRHLADIGISYDDLCFTAASEAQLALRMLKAYSQ